MNGTTDDGLGTNGTSGEMFGPPPQPDTTAQRLIWIIVTSIIIPIGTVGNLLTIVILLKPKNRKSPTAMYLLALAVSDLIILLTAALRWWILFVREWDVRHLNIASCRIHIYLVYASLQFSAWILVAVTMERVVSIIFPHRVKSLSTRRVAGVVICSLLLFVLLLNIHFLLYFGDTYNDIVQDVVLCNPTGEKYPHFYEFVWPWIDLCVAFFLPFVLLVGGNIVIVVRIWKSRGKRRKMSIAHNPQLKVSETGIRQLTIMLFVLGIVFMVSLTPFNVYFIGFPYWARNPNLTVADIENLLIWHAITNCLMFLNATVNFYLYCLSGPKFRNDVVALFCCRASTSTDSVFENRRPSTTTSSTGTFKSPATDSLADSTVTVSQTVDSSDISLSVTSTQDARD